MRTVFRVVVDHGPGSCLRYAGTSRQIPALFTHFSGVRRRHAAHRRHVLQPPRLRYEAELEQWGLCGGPDEGEQARYVVALVLMSAERAKALGIRPLARFVSYAVAGVEPDVMGIGPIKAVPKALARAGLTMDQIALIEFNEAFASQALAVKRELRMPDDRLNVNGGAIALGHPLGASGAKLTTQLVYELGERGGGYGLVTMCIGGGMGAAGVFEI